MSNINLTQYKNNGIELLIDTTTGESFASVNGYARLSGLTASAISQRTSKRVELKTAEIPTTTGLKTIKLITEDLIVEWLPKDNPEMATQLLKLGVRSFLHKLAGYEIKSTAIEVKPKTALELAREQVKILEELERKDLIIESLEEDNEKLSETVDELFSYSSIIRVAKYNNVSEKNFDWRILKKTSTKMGIEIKKVPCPRYVTKNLYSHDVWRVAYPDVPLPETTTLRIYTNDDTV